MSLIKMAFLKCKGLSKADQGDEAYQVVSFEATTSRSSPAAHAQPEQTPSVQEAGGLLSRPGPGKFSSWREAFIDASKRKKALKRSGDFHPIKAHDARQNVPDAYISWCDFALLR